MPSIGRARRMGYMPEAPWERNRMRAPLCHVRWNKGLVTGTGIAAWQDISRHGNALLQAVGAKQGLYNSGGGTAGRGAVVLDGADDFFTAVFPLPKPVTLITVQKYMRAFAAAEDPVDGITGQTMRLYRGSAVQVHQVGDGAGVKDRQNSTFTPEAWHYITSYLDTGTASFVNEDATNKIVPGDSGNAAAGGLTLGAFGNGAANWANIAVMELMVFDYAMSAANAASVTDYMYRGYGL